MAQEEYQESRCILLLPELGLNSGDFSLFSLLSAAEECEFEGNGPSRWWCILF